MARKPKYESVEQIERLIEAYFESCKGEILRDKDGDIVFNQKDGTPVWVNRKPPTIPGLALALGFSSRQSLYNYKARKEFMDTISRAQTRVEQYTAEKLFISTHAPAGGATAIFHKSVMRFCGKLPKDDTVLCLASFGFPRRDPKAVYLAWISCANLPQKCVRQGLALKDQGTSCFHEGLASHAFDPVLV